MKSQNLYGGQELLCVNVDKVYDWITNQSTINPAAAALTFPGGSPNPCAADTTINSVTCDVTQVSAVESAGTRTNRTFVINGAEVTLQRVTILKRVNYTVTVSGITPTGFPFTITSNPATTTVQETFYLCAPEGTTIDVAITDVECSVNYSCATGAFVATITAMLCQSIKVVAPVTIELTADFCQPRENIITACPPPAIPPQCPVLFPPAP